MKKIFLLILLIIISSSIVVATNTLQFQARPKVDGVIQPSETFMYYFNFTTETDCTGNVFTVEKNITTDAYGVGFTEIDIPALTTIPKYLCEYNNKSGSLALRKTHNISSTFFSEAYGYNNVTADYVKANGSELTDLNRSVIVNELNENRTGGFVDFLYLFVTRLGIGIRPDATNTFYIKSAGDNTNPLRIVDESETNSLRFRQTSSGWDLDIYDWLGNGNILLSTYRTSYFTGNLTAENVFIPQYIFSHTNRTHTLIGVNIWTNITFDQEVADIKYGIEHNAMNESNNTFSIMEDGIYEVDYDFDIADSSGTPSDIDVAGRIVYYNGTEVIGSVFETDVTKQGTETELSHDFLMIALAGEQFKFQFVADDGDVIISTHHTFGDHPESATIVIKKIANL